MPSIQAEPAETRHASTVAVDGRAVLIQGPSGSGKSSLALQLMAHGAGLVADDVTALWRREDYIMATAPHPLPRAIECRGIGLIRADLVPAAPVVLIVDLSVTETQRIPEPTGLLLLGIRLPLLHRVDSVHFAAGILQYIRGRGIHPA